ncbi:phosphoenolpyruvate--protein phosphotransferase [Aquimonas sp.]|jgi:phosphotransferase system enzyme I (PtsI)|uniref:phosphoenolpyruvate--protein phosphotransferase n=1 Tax=Aquimonas sp. TaxID=1872588 RepID=UPI0037BFFFA2
MRLVLHGQPASRGLALGRAHVREPQMHEVREENIPAGAADAEIERLHTAIETARNELMLMRQQVQGALAHELGEFLDLHQLILDDPELVLGLDDLIRTALFSADYALKLQRDRLVAVFDAIDDPYMRSRREDVEHVIGRVWAALHRSPISATPGVAGEVLVTDTIAPAELSHLTERGVVAVITGAGSALSHSAILARGLQLPLIVGAHEALAQINDGDALLIDGHTGEIIIEPDADDLRRFKRLQRDNVRERRVLHKLRDAETVTRDGAQIRLLANAESREDVIRAYELGASGIGLYRTEFLFMQAREPPDEESQFLVYRDLVMGMRGRPVTLRTLDLGADKADRAGIALSHEPNPALGLRGVRLSLAQPGLFRSQIRALLRASAYGKVNILVPMVGFREEVLQVRRLIDRCTAELAAEGHAVADKVALGVMIEVPAAALALGSITRGIEFLSIGTNDLVQYLLAIDRGNDAVAAHSSPLHPAVLRVLREILQYGNKRAISTSICGEMAGDIAYTRLLLALGLTEFSLHPAHLLEVRRVIRDSDLGELKKRCARLLRAQDRAGIEAIVAGL